MIHNMVFKPTLEQKQDKLSFIYKLSNSTHEYFCVSQALCSFMYGMRGTVNVLFCTLGHLILVTVMFSVVLIVIAESQDEWDTQGIENAYHRIAQVAKGLCIQV